MKCSCYVNINKKGEIMKKKSFNKRTAFALAVLATGSLAVSSIIPTFNNAGFFANSGLAIKAEAADYEEIVLGDNELTLDASGTKVTGLKPDGETLLTTARVSASAIEGGMVSIKFDSSLGITEIGNSAFEDKTIMGKITIPASVTKIGKNAFYNNAITEVVIEGTLTEVGAYAFADNAIESVDLSKFTVVGDIKEAPYLIAHPASNGNGRNVPYRKFGDTVNQVIIPEGLFENNSLTNVVIPSNVKAISFEAFSGNKLTELTIPENVNMIYHDAFKDNTDLKNLNLDAATGLRGIADSAFEGCSIENDITFPSSIKKIGAYAFKMNKIQNVSFEKTSPEITDAAFNGNDTGIFDEAFAENPLVSVKGLDSTYLGCKVFQNTKALKNISFNSAPKFSQMYAKTFENGKLKSLKFPKNIDDINDWAGLGNPFEGNEGWYPGDPKKAVALYRVDENGNPYLTNDNLADNIYYVINPILVEFSLKDRNGNDLFNTLKPNEIEREGWADKVTSPKAIDYEHYKLGDKLIFNLGAALPENYQLAVLVKNPDGTVASETALTPDPTGKYEVTLDPNNNQIVEEVSYGDGYEVGYKKTTFILKYTGSSSSGEPVVPYEPSTPSTPEQPATPSTPAQPATPANNTDNGNAPQINNNVDINDQNTPQGNTDIDDDSTPQGNTVIDDDTTPQGKAKTGTKVKADNSDKINIEDTKSPLGQLPRTGGSNDSYLVLLGGALIGLGIVVKRKIR